MNPLRGILPHRPLQRGQLLGKLEAKRKAVAKSLKTANDAHCTMKLAVASEVIRAYRWSFPLRKKSEIGSIRIKKAKVKNVYLEYREKKHRESCFFY